MKMPVEINGNLYLPVRQAAENFGYSRDHITRLAQAKKVVAMHIGRFWYINEKSLASYFSDQQIEAKIRKNILSKDRQIELRVNNALSAVEGQRKIRSVKSGHVAAVSACLMFALLLGSASQFFVDSIPLQSSLVLSQERVLPAAESSDDLLYPVFSDRDVAVVVDEGREIYKPVVTPQWVQIKP